MDIFHDCMETGEVMVKFLVLLIKAPKEADYLEEEKALYVFWNTL